MVDNSSVNSYVTLRCNNCGKEWGFFPWRVMFTNPCDCGNDDYGNPLRWVDDEFGNFTLVCREEWVLPSLLPTPGLLV